MKKQLFMMLSLGVLMLMSACTGKGTAANNMLTAAAQDSTNYFFGGEFVYLADAATLKDCATGKVFPISTAQGQYLDVERKYTSLGIQPGEPVYAEFRGVIVTEPSMEEGKTQQALVIQEFLEFNNTLGCNGDMVVPGVYEAILPVNDTTQVVYTLNMNSDYTCLMSDNGINVSQEYPGTWYRTLEDEAVVIINTEKLNKRYPVIINYGTEKTMLYFPDFSGNTSLNFVKRVGL